MPVDPVSDTPQRVSATSRRVAGLILAVQINIAILASIGALVALATVATGIWLWNRKAKAEREVSGGSRALSYAMNTLLLGRPWHYRVCHRMSKWSFSTILPVCREKIRASGTSRRCLDLSLDFGDYSISIHFAEVIIHLQDSV